MKTKLSKFLGVALTLVMVLTMTVAFAAPVAADEEEWSEFDIPVTGIDGDYFMDSAIESLGPFAKAIDDTLYLYTELDPGGATFTVTGGTYTTTRITDQLGTIECDFTGSWTTGTPSYGSFYATADADFKVGVVLITAGTIIVTGTLSETSITFSGTVEWTSGADITDDTLTIDDGTIGVSVGGAFEANLWDETDTINLLVTGGDVAMSMLLKSDDGGRTWEETDYLADTVGGTIVDIACSSEDADILYVATATNVYMSDDAGDADSWGEIGAATIPAGTASNDINSIAVGYCDDTPYVYITLTNIGDYSGEVFYLEDASWAREWKDLALGSYTNTNLDALTIACSPFFDDDTQVDIVVSDATPYTAVLSNIGGSVGDWTQVAELQIEDTTSFRATAASDIGYVADFEDEYELFVGVVEVTAAGLGDVYRIGEVLAFDLGVDADICSLDVVGEYGDTSLIAGEQVTAGPANIFFSTDDGDTWDDAIDEGKPPTGVGATSNLVVLDDDFADSEIAWCASNAASEGAVSLTADSGATWNGISMIDTDMAGEVYDIAPGSDLFMVTQSSADTDDDSVWKYDGTYWERVWLDTDNDLDLVEKSPDYAGDEAVFVADSAAPVILYSHDVGATFTEMTRQPEAITSWVVIDSDTIITGDADGDYYKTDRYGRRTWDTDEISVVGNEITDLVISPNFISDGTVLAGDDESLVYISTDEGETWDELSDSDVAGLSTTDGPTYVGFDADYASNNFIYAASDDVVARCEIDDALDIDEQEFDDMGVVIDDAADLTAADMAVAADGTLYVADATIGDIGDETVVLEGGLRRCLNPTDDLADIVFESPAAGLADGMTFEGNLRLTAGSNILWAIDTAATPDIIWSYEDTLVGPVVAELPGEDAFLPDEDRVEFDWEDLNADTVAQYDLEVYELQDWLDDAAATETFTPDDSEAIWIEADPGTTYVWRVRVSEGSPVASRWSEVRTFITKVGMAEAPINVRPEPGAQDIILKPTFDWLPVDGADTYKIEVAENTDFSPLVTSGTSALNVWVCDVELDYSTTYFWSVSGVSAGASIGDPVISVFTTMAAPEAAVPPVVITPTPAAPAPEVVIPAATPITPAWIYVIIAIGAALAIAVIILIVRTRRVV